MSIEVSRTSFYIYRISLTDPLVIERRENRRGTHWYFYAHRDTPEQARAALLQIGKDETEENDAL